MAGETAEMNRPTAASSIPSPVQSSSSSDPLILAPTPATIALPSSFLSLPPNVHPGPIGRDSESRSSPNLDNEPLAASTSFTSTTTATRHATASSLTQPDNRRTFSEPVAAITSSSAAASSSSSSSGWFGWLGWGGSQSTNSSDARDASASAAQVAASSSDAIATSASHSSDDSLSKPPIIRAASAPVDADHVAQSSNGADEDDVDTLGGQPSDWMHSLFTYTLNKLCRFPDKEEGMEERYSNILCRELVKIRTDIDEEELERRRNIASDGGSHRATSVHSTSTSTNDSSTVDEDDEDDDTVPIYLEMSHFYPAGFHRIPLPVILIRSPYDRLLMRHTAERIVPFGYHVLVQDTRNAPNESAVEFKRRLKLVRERRARKRAAAALAKQNTAAENGQNQSDEADVSSLGAATASDPVVEHNEEFFPIVHEHHDGLATLKWIRRQPWCDGNIAFFGASYLSLAAWSIVDARIPELKCLVPVVAASNVFNILFPEGSLNLDLAARWLFIMFSPGVTGEPGDSGSSGSGSGTGSGQASRNNSDGSEEEQQQQAMNASMAAAMARAPSTASTADVQAAADAATSLPGFWARSYARVVGSRRTIPRALNSLPACDLDLAVAGRRLEFWQEALRNSRDPHSEFWRSKRVKLASISNAPPMLLVEGWYDLFLKEALRDYEEALRCFQDFQRDLEEGRVTPDEAQALGPSVKTFQPYLTILHVAHIDWMHLYRHSLTESIAWYNFHCKSGDDQAGARALVDRPASRSVRIQMIHASGRNGERHRAKVARRKAAERALRDLIDEYPNPAQAVEDEQRILSRLRPSDRSILQDAAEAIGAPRVLDLVSRRSRARYRQQLLDAEWRHFPVWPPPGIQRIAWYCHVERDETGKEFRTLRCHAPLSEEQYAAMAAAQSGTGGGAGGGGNKQQKDSTNAATLEEIVEGASASASRNVSASGSRSGTPALDPSTPPHRGHHRVSASQPFVLHDNGGGSGTATFMTPSPSPTAASVSSPSATFTLCSPESGRIGASPPGSPPVFSLPSSVHSPTFQPLSPVSSAGGAGSRAIRFSSVSLSSGSSFGTSSPLMKSSSFSPMSSAAALNGASSSSSASSSSPSSSVVTFSIPASAFSTRPSGAMGKLSPVPYSCYTYDPADPTPVIGGATFDVENSGAMDNAPMENRSDVLVFSSEPLSAPVVVIGPVSAVLYVRSTCLVTDFVARLCDVYPVDASSTPAQKKRGTGESQILCDGLCKVTPIKVDENGWIVEEGTETRAESEKRIYGKSISSTTNASSSSSSSSSSDSDQSSGALTVRRPAGGAITLSSKASGMPKELLVGPFYPITAPDTRTPLLKIEVDMWATGTVFQVGHRIRFHVCSAAHPRWLRSLGGADPLFEGLEAARLQHQTLYHDPAHPSHIILPVLSE